MRLKLHVLLLKEGDAWVAQCLEYDIAAQGPTIADAQESFATTLVGQMLVDIHHGKAPLGGVPQAPERYWALYRQKAARLARPLPIRVPDAVAKATPRPIRTVASEFRVA